MAVPCFGLVTCPLWEWHASNMLAREWIWSRNVMNLKPSQYSVQWTIFTNERWKITGMKLACKWSYTYTAIRKQTSSCLVWYMYGGTLVKLGSNGRAAELIDIFCVVTGCYVWWELMLLFVCCVPLLGIIFSNFTTILGIMELGRNW